MAGKIIGAAMIIAACMGFGGRLALRQILRRDELLEIRNIISNILSNMEYGRMTFEEALVNSVENIDENDIFSSVLTSMKNGNGIRNAWKYSFENCKDTYMTKEDREMIARLGEGLSSGDITLQKNYGENIANYIDSRCEIIGRKASDDTRLYRSVSITIGIFIVVLLV